MPETTSPRRLRAAAVQFAVTTDVAANLDTCLRMIDRAAAVTPDVIVLPEFCNHIAWWRDRSHCHDTAVDIGGAFLNAIADRARRHACYIKLNCTVRRAPDAIAGTNLLFDRTGRLIADGDKQVLMGNENNFLERATQCTEIARTPEAAFGMYCCMDGVVPEVARSLALRGADVLLNSLNSFAFDEAGLHIPVRAAENRVFVVAANKVGALVPPAMLDAIATRMKIAPRFLHGAGESQIVDPEGRVLARAPREGEHVVWADIDVSAARQKRDAHGAEVFAWRRPQVYAPLASTPTPRVRVAQTECASVATVVGTQNNMDAVAVAARSGSRLVVLPELDSASVTEEAGYVRTVQRAIGGFDICVVTAMRTAGNCFESLLIDQGGIRLRQRQIHRSARLPWHTRLSDMLNTVDLGWACVALVSADDAIYPEVFRLAALAECELVAVPTASCLTWQSQYGYAERAAENRLAVVVSACLPQDAGIFAADPDFTLWAEWKTRPFDGCISQPRITKPVGDGVTVGDVYPAAANNRMVSQKTNLIESRPWNLIDALVR